MSAHPTISDVAMQLATRRTEPTSSVKITRNAKQEIQFEVDVTHTDPKVALDLAKTITADLEKAYPPHANGAA